jgi:hypothetical protein
MQPEADESSSDEDDVVNPGEAAAPAAGSKKKRKRKKKKKPLTDPDAPAPTSTVKSAVTVGDAADKHTEAAKPSKRFAKVPQSEKLAAVQPQKAALPAATTSAATAAAATTASSSSAAAAETFGHVLAAKQSTTAAAAAAAAAMQSSIVQSKEKKSVENGSYSSYYEGRQAGGRGGVGSADPRLQLLQERWFKDRRCVHYNLRTPTSMHSRAPTFMLIR